MPIVGLTDRGSVEGRFRDLGKICKGMRDASAPGGMVDLEYFRFVSKDAEIQAAFDAVYGKEPTLIHVILPSARTEDMWKTWMEEWGASGLIHRCNGVHMVRWLTKDKRYESDMEMLQKRPCPYASGEKERTKERPGCTEHGYLTVVVPALLEAGFFGYVTVRTTSINDLANITACLFEAEEKARNVGRPNGLAGAPFVLRRQEEEIGVRYKNKKGEIVKTRGMKWMVRLDPTQEWALRLFEEARSYALGRPAPAWQLESGEAGGAAEKVAGELVDGINDAGDDWDEVAFAAGESEEVDTETPPEVQAAMDFTTKSGDRLGEQSKDWLSNAVDQVNALRSPNTYSKRVRNHCLTLLKWMEQFEQSQQEQQEQAA
jgi:hypothetical protein